MQEMPRVSSKSFTRWLVSAAALLALTTPTLRAQPFQLIRQWGTAGTGPGQFGYPRGIALSRNGNVYVTDEVNARVQVFDENGNFLFQFGNPGSGPGQLGAPWGITVGPDENVYVTDLSGLPRLHKFSSTGSFLADLPVNGGFGPRDVAVDAAGNLYIAAEEAQRVYKLAPDGTFLRAWGGEGSAPGQFQFPQGIAVGPTGNVFVSDHARIQKFDSQGSFLAAWSRPGMSFGQIDVDRFGNVYNPDFDSSVNWKFDSQGNLLATWPEFTVFQFTFLSIAATGRGEVYVIDTNNNRILEYLDLSVARIFSDAFESGSTAAWISSPAD
ncbi:MAG: hypothetical protein QOF89_5891 [Acidobacteriota bacterium]|jgi:DNA-binding beta-propeller fold protein YncE|nr:hypothetical protein [Acidobacteriota bacterium]